MFAILFVTFQVPARKALVILLIYLNQLIEQNIRLSHVAFFILADEIRSGSD